MLNYEDLYNELQPVLKKLKDAASAAGRQQKAVTKGVESGNLTDVKKLIEAMKVTAADLSRTIEDLSGLTQEFDTRAYFAEGDFTRQLLQACEDRGIDVVGERGNYEMFPFKVKIAGDEDHDGEVYINRKKLPSCRPSYVADSIHNNQEKLFRARFNAVSFMNEIADAYETACLKSGARIGSTQKLDKIYKAMAPTSRARKEYDKMAFAFDLARIYEAGPDAWVTRAGERYDFGTSRDGKTGYRALSSTGTENFIYTVKPLKDLE